MQVAEVAMDESPVHLPALFADPPAQALVIGNKSLVFEVVNTVTAA
jgi:hypothetical protein